MSRRARNRADAIEAKHYPQADDAADASDWWLDSPWPMPDEGEQYAADEVAHHQAMVIREDRT